MRNQHELEQLVRDILGPSYLRLRIPSYTLREDAPQQRAHIQCQLELNVGERRRVEGAGVGLVDALFRGLRRELAVDYPSLEGLRFVELNVAGDFSQPGACQAHSRSDAPGLVRLVVANSDGRRFTFEASSLSIGASSVDAVTRVVEHFVNADRAVVRVFSWLEDARRRDRHELVDRYTGCLAELVENTSYAETLGRVRAAA